MNKLIFFTLSFVVLFSGCSIKNKYSYSNPKIYSGNQNDYSESIPKKAYKHPTMRSYVVFGVRYYPKNVNVGNIFKGNASWYGPNFNGKLTSNGETYDMYAMTAAHKTFPMNTMVKVTNQRNGKIVIVRINDRGPFKATRIIDLSKAAARKVDMIASGTAPVTVEVLGFYSKGKKIKKRVYKKRSYKSAQNKNTSNFRYALQIASFSNIEGAIKIQERYDNIDGYKTVIKDIDSSNGRSFKVFLRGFKNEQEIRNYKANSEFNGSFVVKEE